jgi:Tol biopolymer transport system component
VWRRLPILLLLSVAILIGAAAFETTTRAQTAERCFAETGYCISGRIREFWEQNGGLSVFGMPITTQRDEMIEGEIWPTQWFERNRLELHSDNPPPYDVQLGRLGADALRLQGRDWHDFPKMAPQAGCRYFPETGHNICAEMLQAWRANGLELDGLSGKSQEESIALFGMPLSNARTETLSDGNAYVVQWFERARFELHPAGAPFPFVMLGLLGVEVREALPAVPPSPTVIPLTPTPAPVMPTATLTPTATVTPTVPLTPTATAPPAPLEPTPPITSTAPTSPTISGPSRIAFVSSRSGNNDIYVMNTDGSQLVNLTGDPAGDLQPAWSPDGTRIAFVSNRSGNNDIYVMNADGSQQMNLTSHDAEDIHPTWSPDGTRIAFASSRGGGTNIYTITPAGEEVVQLTRAPGINEAPVWSPDGTRLAFVSNRDNGNWEIYTMNADGTDQVNITNAADDDRDPAWSPDGTRIAFVSNRAGDWEIFLMNVDGSAQTIFNDTPDDDGGPAWSPDGAQMIFHTLVFVSGESPNYEIYRVNLDGSGLQNLTSHPATDIQAAWSP